MLIPRIKLLLDANNKNYQRRKRYIINKRSYNDIIIDNQSLIDFSHNDYLHISNHTSVKNAYLSHAKSSNISSSASPFISGYTNLHRNLEDKFAEFLNRERALLFNSGYHANLGVITTFANRNSIVIADKFCHASLIDGITLSRAKHHRYAHNDINHVKKLIYKNIHKEKLLITESIFSIHGDISHIKELADVAHDNNTTFIVDDAHGVGVMGNEGRGITEYLNLPSHLISCLITPLGKAMGSFGAIVSGSHMHMEAVLQFARTLKYSTALPPALCSANIAAIDVIRKENWRRERLQYLIQLFVSEATKRNLELFSLDPTPIKSIRIGSNKHALNMQQYLYKLGYFVACIRPPTVSKHHACIRISLNCLHEENQIIALLNHIKTYQEENYD